MNRRDFLKNAALGSAALASLPPVISTLSTPASALPIAGTGRRSFAFVSQSQSGTEDRIAMAGEGTFKVQSNQIVGQGEGTWFHFDPVPPPPKPLKAFGKWIAKDFVSYNTNIPATGLPGIYGRTQASIVVINIDLLRDFPSPATIPATLEVVCDIGALGAAGNTGEDEGFMLAIPGTQFAEDATPGPFVQLSPVVGISGITIADE